MYINYDYGFDFIRTYSGPKIAIVTSGGGVSLSELLVVPGASKVLHGVNNLYSQEFVQDFLGIVPEKYTSKDQAVELLKKQSSLLPSGDIVIAVCSSLITSRYRHGENHGYIAIGTSDKYKVYHVEFPHLTEQDYNNISRDQYGLIDTRLSQDNIISLLSLILLMIPLDNISIKDIDETIKVTDVTRE